MEKEDKMQEESSTSKGWPTGEGQLQEGTNVNSDCTDPPPWIQPGAAPYKVHGTKASSDQRSTYGLVNRHEVPAKKV